MRILGFIPARSGSKGVPDKNIKKISGVPLLCFSVWTAVKSGAFEDILVSTDSREYLGLVAGLGVRTDYLRPKSLSDDHSPTIAAVSHALDWYEAQGKSYTAVMILQPTAPFRTPDHISRAIGLLSKYPEATCVTGVVQLGDTHPARIKRLDSGTWLRDFCCAKEPEPSRRQDLSPPAYLRNGTIYLSPLSTIQGQNRIRGEKVIGMEMPEANSINVDTHLDFLTAEVSLTYPPYRKDLSFFDELISLYGQPL